ncbi:MAG TPA: UvrB/UvrC motif-containing protein [Anaerohalosphaeraceae bacterium]|nr:UvrB/UvrC motif-containing protein [Anaerohalosphaeraceae bacterium]
MPPRLEESFVSSLSLGSETEIIPALAGIPARRGLVLFADSADRPIQMLLCADLRRTARARLLTQNRQLSRKADISKVCTRIYYTCIQCEFACQKAYISLCRTYFHDQLADLVQLPKPCFVKLETRLKLPWFAVTDKPTLDKNTAIWGPFITRKNANQYAEILTKAFGLCRNAECLSSGRYDLCPYYQMKTCPGPCLRPEQLAQYQQTIADAVSVADAGPDEHIATLTASMQTLSKNLEFEKARHVRDQIELLKKLTQPEFREIGPLSAFRILHIDLAQKDKKNLLWIAFVATASDIRELTFSLEQLDTVISAVRDVDTCQTDTRPAQIQENLGLICRFLYRSKKAGLWLNCSDGNCLKPDTLLEQIKIAFPKVSLDFDKMQSQEEAD